MIWDACSGTQHIGHLSGTLHRLVESQEQVATLGYVDTLYEQALLESMLEESKPLYKEDLTTYHYLLATPFRYPPLKWGSRFGSINEPSLFYGGKTINVTLVESAYYRFVFWNSMSGTPIKPHIKSEHSLLSVDYITSKGVSLHKAPFDRYQHDISHPSQYGQSQQLGSAMRTSGVEVFEYTSARDTQKEHCAGLFTAHAFKSKKPKSMTHWLCETSAHEVLFKPAEFNTITRFKLDAFLINNTLPMPA